jgi:copper chaperone CopZ
MFRRQFMQIVALTSVGALNPVESIAAINDTTAVFQVKGFTCITCAVGLDTLLGKEKGIVSSRSIYPDGKVTVIFDPMKCSEEAIRKFITDMGFSVISSHPA